MTARQAPFTLPRMSFECVVVTPEQQAFSDTVKQVILPAHDGLMGILTDRAPLLVKLGMGPLRLERVKGAQETFFVDGGVAQMKDNRLTILTDHAVASSQIDVETAKAEYAEAAARHATDEASRRRREHRMAAARIKQDIATPAR